MFSERLKRLRSEKGVMQKDVADYLGITSSAYGFYEQSKRQPDNDTLQKLADYFNVSIDYLLGRSDIRNTSNLVSDLSASYFANIKGEIKPEDIPDDFAMKAAGVIRRSSTTMTEDEQSLLLDMIKSFIASVENRKRAQHESQRGKDQGSGEETEKDPSH